MNRLDFDKLYIDDLIADVSRGHIDVLNAMYSEGSTVIAIIVKNMASNLSHCMSLEISQQ